MYMSIQRGIYCLNILKYTTSEGKVSEERKEKQEGREDKRKPGSEESLVISFEAILTCMNRRGCC